MSLGLGRQQSGQQRHAFDPLERETFTISEVDHIFPEMLHVEIILDEIAAASRPERDLDFMKQFNVAPSNPPLAATLHDQQRFVPYANPHPRLSPRLPEAVDTIADQPE